MKGATHHVARTQKKLMEELSLVQPPVRDRCEKCPGWKRIDMAYSPVADTQLSSQIKKLGDKKAKQKTPPKNIYPEFYIVNKYRMVTLLKMKWKRLF